MNFDSINNSSIYGESNIIRYLNSLLVGENKSINQNVLLNDLIDLCTNQLKFSNDSKINSNYLNNLNKILKSSKWLLSNDQLTIADVYVWSVLKQKLNNKIDLKSTENVNKWIQRFEQSEHFNVLKPLF